VLLLGGVAVGEAPSPLLRAALGAIPRAQVIRALRTTSISSTSTRSRVARIPRRISSNSIVSMAAGARFEVECERAISIGGKRVSFSAAVSPGEVPWGELGCEIVLECTGKFLKLQQLEAYFERGVKRVIVTAPVKDAAALNIVVGVNEQLYDPARHRLLTAASCTTNCSHRL
jgi:glyceraldehyde-3-phosphate dehydrogenase/erythrose-4-phosphate dehydrogenase